MLTKEEKTDSLETQTNRNIIAKTQISILKSLNVQGRHDKMKLQAALDFDYRSANEAQTKEHPVDLAIFWSELAKKLVSEAKESIDIIEVGTPFVMEYGLAPVKELKAAFPEKTILADLKIADAGYYEAAAAFKNGADIATVLAVTDDATIRNAVAAAREYGCAIMVDMLAVPNLPERLTQVDAMGVDYICLHTSKDLQRLDKDKELVRGSVEETLNELLEQEAEKLTQAARYERNEARQGYRSGHYDRNLTTTSGDVTLHVPRLKGISFETAIIERYRRRESSVEEALIEMYLAGVSVRRVEDITEALWGSKVSPATISELNKKAYVHIEDWRNRPLQGGKYPYVYVDGIYLRRNWGGEYENVAVLVAIAVNEDGYREVLGAAEGMKEDKASWVNFFQWLKSRGLDGVKLIVGDKCLGMLEAVGEVFPDAKYQRCTVHFYRNVFSVVPRSKVKLVAKMLKAIHAQENKKASREKAKAVVAELRAMKLKEAAKKVEDGVEETLTYCDFPSEHWTRIRTNNVIERLNREIRRRTRVVGTFPDGNSALMLVCARLRHVAGTQWGNKKYMNMKHLETPLEDASIAG